MARDIRQRIIIDAADRTAAATKTAQNNLSKVEGAVKRLENTIIGFAGVSFLFNVSRDLIKLSDTAVNLNGRLKLATDTTAQFADAQQRMVDISLSNGTALEATVTLFGRINKPLQDLNFTLDDSAKLTQLMAEGLKISGASTAESAGTMLQFSQAIQSGVLRGEELNSLMEQGGRITQALAAGLGVSTGRLKEMGAAGELTSDKVIKALLSQADAVHKESLSVQFSFSQAMENIKTKIIDTFQNNTAMNNFLADMARGVAGNFDQIVDVLLPALEIALLTFVGLMTKWAAGKATVAKHTRDQLALEEVLQNKAKLRATLEDASARRKERDIAVELEATTKLESFKANAALRRAREAKAEQLANVQRIRGLITELELQAQLGAAALRSETNAGRRVVIGQQLAQMQLRLTAYTEQLTAAETKLTTGTNALSAAVRAQQAAVDANTAARTRNGIAGATMLRYTTDYSNRISALAQANMNRSAGMATVATANIAAVGNKLTAVMGRVGGALLGWPGMIALIGYQVADHFIDMEVAAWALERGLYRLLVQAAGIWDALFNRDQYKAAMEAFDAETSTQIDDMLAKREAAAKGFKSVEEMQIAVKKEAVEQEAKLEDARLRKLLGTRDQAKIAEDKLIKFKVEALKALTKTNKEMDEASAKSLATRITEIKFAAEIENTLIDGTGANFAEVQKRKQETSKSTNEAILKAEIESIDERRKRWTADFAKELDGLEVNSKAYLKIAMAQQKQLASLDKDTVKSLGDSLKQMAALRDGYLKSVAAGVDEINSLERSKRDFMREMQAGTLSDYEESAEAQTRIQEVQDSLRKISTLDQIKDADKIKAIRDQASQDIQAIARDEKSRAESLDKNSVAEIAATRNKQDAMNLYNQVMDAAITDRKALNEYETEAAKNIQETIIERAETLKEYQASIAKADELVAKQRELLIRANTSDAENKLNDLINRLAEVQKRMAEIGVSGEGSTVNMSAVNSAADAATAAGSTSTYKIPGSVNNISNVTSTSSNSRAVTNVTSTGSNSASTINNSTLDNTRKTYTLANLSAFENSSQYIPSGTTSNNVLKDLSAFENSSEYIARNSGGEVPGTGNTDTVPAMLTPGEFVIKKETVAKFISQFGPDALYKMNAGVLPVVREVPPVKSIFRNTGGAVSQSVIDRKIGDIRSSISDQKLATEDAPYSQSQSLFGQENVFLENSWQNDYYDSLMELVEGLDGKDYRTVRNMQNYFGKALNILEKSNRRNTRRNYYDEQGDDMRALDEMIENISVGIANAPDYEEPTTSSSSRSSSGSRSSSSSRSRSGGFIPSPVQLPKSEADILEQARIDGMTGRSLIPTYNLLTNEFDTIASAVAANSTIPAAPGQQYANSSSGGDPIVIEFKFGENAASGTFANDDATLAMLNELKKVGLSSAK